MARDVTPAPLARCLLVWLSATLAAGGVAGALLPDLIGAGGLLAHGPTVRFEQLLVGCCELALVLAAGWAWLVTTVVATQAARGHRSSGHGIPAPLRRVVLLACGTVLVGGLAAPSHADGRDAVQGLPLPDRASTALHVAHLVARHGHRDRAAAASAAEKDLAPTVVVAPGDTLWRLATATLAPGSSTSAVAARVHQIHRTNRAVIGANPDLIQPGQRLRLPRRGEETR